MSKHHSILKSAVISTLLIVFVILRANAGGGDVNQGVKFRSITFKQALAASKAENKPIFIHGFADWCHYCEYMKDSVYPDKEVGDYFNSHFICLKIDLEKEGAEMNKTLNVHSFPVYLFYDANGEMFHRAAGRKYKPAFLELGKEALDPNRQMLTRKKMFESGKASPTETESYLRMLEMAGMDAQPMLDDYLMKQSDSDFTNDNNWKIIYDIMKDPTLRVMKRIISSKKELEKVHTADTVNNKLIIIFNTYLMQYVQLLDSNGYETARQSIMHMKGLDIAEKICAYAELNKHKMKYEWDVYKTDGKKFIEQYAMDDYRRINDIAGNFKDHFANDKESMALAEQWMVRSVSLADTYRANHLLASVYAANGKKEQAMSTANHAIELAKRTRTDYTQTTQLLSTIEKLQ